MDYMVTPRNVMDPRRVSRRLRIKRACSEWGDAMAQAPVGLDSVRRGGLVPALSCHGLAH